MLFSLHLKATMMKVSDPIIFGHAVEVFFKDLIAKHGATLDGLGVDFNNGFGDLVAEARQAPADKKAEIEADIQAPTPTARRSRWSTPTRASPTSTSRATSSSTPPCPP